METAYRRDSGDQREGHPFTDHSVYWANNQHQVIPKLVSEIWGDRAMDHFRLGNPEPLERLKRRKYRVLILFFPRVAAWFLFPLMLFATIKFVNLKEFRHDVLGIPYPGESIVAELPRDVATTGVYVIWSRDRDWIDTAYDWAIIGTTFIRPDAWWEQTLMALTVAGVVTILAKLLYKFVRAHPLGWVLRGLEYSPRLVKPEQRRMVNNRLLSPARRQSEM